MLELLDAGAYITVDPDGPDPAVTIEGGGKNPPQINKSDVDTLLELEWITDVWDDELEGTTRPRFTISAMGRQYLEDNPSEASRSPSTPVDPKETGDPVHE